MSPPIPEEKHRSIQQQTHASSQGRFNSRKSSLICAFLHVKNVSRKFGNAQSLMFDGLSRSRDNIEPFLSESSSISVDPSCPVARNISVSSSLCTSRKSELTHGHESLLPYKDRQHFSQPQKRKLEEDHKAAKFGFANLRFLHPRGKVREFLG